MSKKIVYHGTLSDEAPHTYGYPFHAGTLRAADDRVADEESYGVDWDEAGAGVASVHAYEVSDTAPTSKKTWEDPMYFENEKTAVPEHKENRIYPYKNMREDKGSTSYVIPSSFVGNHVKHLGIQFQWFVGPNASERGEAALRAASVMSGGRFKHD